jgi:hypothetical protein
MGLSFTIPPDPRIAVILRSQSRGLMTIFYCLIIETPPTWRSTSLYLYPPETGWPSYTLRHWVPSSSLPTTLRAKPTSLIAPTVLLITSRHGPQSRHRSCVALSNCCVQTCLFAKSLLSTGCCIFYLEVVAQQRSNMPQYIWPR